MKLNITKYFEQTAVITVYRLHDRLVDKSLLFIYIHTLNLVVFYIYFHIFTALYFSFIQKVSATHAPTHYLWFLQ